MWWWRRSLPRAATAADRAAYLARFQQFHDSEMLPIPNTIKEPTVWNPKPGVSARWYDRGAEIVPISRKVIDQIVADKHRPSGGKD
jgi:hypothetical protein